ncbi:PAS domain-containing protein, partial [Streptomyces albiflaviniger]|nr:PAS domain-containing protein [Streptomyces albiflaviniger]
ALQPAVAGLGGLGGMAHLSGRRATRALTLVVSSGLPRGFTRPWESVSGDAAVAPACAIRDELPVWLPPPSTDAHSAGQEQANGAFPADTGMVAVPLPDPDGPLGALSVLVDTPGGPDPARLAFLEKVARWAAGRLHRNVPVSQDTSLTCREAFDAVKVGAWDWDLHTGAVSMNEQMVSIFGMEPGTYDGRLESWTALIHPDDLPWVVTENNRAIRSRDLIAHEYRIRCPDRKTRWVQSRGRVVLDADDQPTHMVGTLWDTTEIHTSQESVGRALRHMSDGFLAVGNDWRVTFLNIQAELLFGSSQEVVGRFLRDIPAVKKVPELKERCRQAGVSGSPSGFDLRWPDNDRWYHLRLVPVPNGLTIYFTDITDRRLRDAQRAATERAAAERAARIRELTASLAAAVSKQDVATAVAERVLPPFGAKGLVVQVLEGDRLHLVGAVGYTTESLDRIRAMSLGAGTPVTDALRTGDPKFVESVAECRATYPEAADSPALVGNGAWVVLPLITSGQPMGTCVISFDQPRRFTGEERTLLTAVSGLVAQALGRARLYDAEHSRARELQRGLLPRALPMLPGVTAAARYLPTGQGVDVGGDWYDIIPLSGDRVALVIGDVVGHGLSEAATMGRLRTAVHTLSGLELPPTRSSATSTTS